MVHGLWRDWSGTLMTTLILFQGQDITPPPFSYLFTTNHDLSFHLVSSPMTHDPLRQMSVYQSIEEWLYWKNFFPFSVLLIVYSVRP